MGFPPIPALRRSSSHRAQRRPPRTLAVVVAAVTVAGAAGLAISALHRAADDRRRSEAALADLSAETNWQSSLDWRAVASGGADRSLLEEAEETNARLRSQLARLRLDDGAEIASITRVGAAYAEATREEFELFAQGLVEQAERVDEERVDPTFDELQDMIAGARGQIARRADRASLLAELGTFAVLLIAALLIGVLFWHFERARRRAHEAFYDPLTGLANRAFFADRVTHALATANRRDERVAILFLDLDDFKAVNDTLGHRAGDRLLVQVGERIASCARESDTVARLGGDEFAVLLEGRVDDKSAKRFADRLSTALVAPFVLEGRDVHVSATVGCALSHAGQEDPDELLRNADLAMYSGKRMGNARFTVYEPSMHSALVDRLQLEADLGQALERGQLSVHYQPIVDIASGSLTCVEALARWQHPDRGYVPPALFIPLAEETGVIRQLGPWVLEEACQQMRRWQIEHSLEPPLSVSVNVSPSQLGHGELVGQVSDALGRAGLAPDRLVLEITESVLVERGDVFLSELEELAAVGVRLAVDDFGIGYSSLSFLSRFPVHMLKIDKSFVDKVDDDDGGFRLVASILELSRSLGLEPVAEGIELPAQLAALRELGCGFGQGYHFARPMEPEQLSALLRATSADTDVRRGAAARPVIGPPASESA